MKTIPKYQIGKPLPLAESYDLPWVKEAKQKQIAEEKEYQEAMKQPYYKTHPKPTLQQWKQQQAKIAQNQGEIKAHRKVSAPVRAINNYIGEARHRAGDGTILLKGKYVLPAIGIASTMPILAAKSLATTGATMGAGYVGGKAFDGASKLLTGKNWAENMYDWTGLDPLAGEITNPGVLAGGGAPLLHKGTRTLLSAGDQIITDVASDVAKNGPTAAKTLLLAGNQIITDAGKDIIKYGPAAIYRNPAGWYRPYVDQLRNGYQGWKDFNQFDPEVTTIGVPPKGKNIVKSPIQDQAINGRPVDEYIDPDRGYRIYITKRSPKLEAYSQEGSDGIGFGLSKDASRTVGVHIGNDIERKAQRTILEKIDELPPGTYYGDFGDSKLTGQIASDFVRTFGRKPTLGELIRMSKMDPEVIVGKYTPLSPFSYNWITRRPNHRYTNSYMRNFNNQSKGGDGLHYLNGRNFSDKPVDEQLKLINEFISGLRTPEPTRNAFIGLDGELRIPIISAMR